MRVDEKMKEKEANKMNMASYRWDISLWRKERSDRPEKLNELIMKEL